MADEMKSPSPGNPESAGSKGAPLASVPGQQPQQFNTDASDVSTVYTNFCHVTGTPEELILDFGLNTQMNPTPSEPIMLTHRVVMNFYTAKRLLNALHFAVSRHETAFGVLELDFQRRAKGVLPPTTPQRPAAGGGFRP